MTCFSASRRHQNTKRRSFILIDWRPTTIGNFSCSTDGYFELWFFPWDTGQMQWIINKTCSRFRKDFKMISRWFQDVFKNSRWTNSRDGPFGRVREGSARLKMMPFWFGFGSELFFKRRTLLVGWTKDQPAWRRRLLFHLILRLSGRQSEKRGNNVMCSSTIIEYKNKSVAKRWVCCCSRLNLVKLLIWELIDNTLWVFIIFNKLHSCSFINMSFVYCTCVWL